MPTAAERASQVSVHHMVSNEEALLGQSALKIQARNTSAKWLQLLGDLVLRA